MVSIIFYILLKYPLQLPLYVAPTLYSEQVRVLTGTYSILQQANMSEPCYDTIKTVGGIMKGWRMKLLVFQTPV